MIFFLKRLPSSLWAVPIISSVFCAGLGAARQPSGSALYSVTVVVTTAAEGDTVPARCSVTDSEGDHRYPPPGQSFYHDVAGGYFYSSGAFTLIMPGGPSVFRAGRGFESVPVEEQWLISSDTTVTLSLRGLCKPGEAGLFGGDVHVHLNHGPGYYTLGPPEARTIAMAEGLSVINCLDNSYFFTGGPDPCSDGECVVFMSEERRSGVWGHYGLLGLDRLIEPFGSDWGRLLGEVADSAHAQGGALVTAAHPVSSEDFFQTIVWPGSGIARELPVDAALGRVDAFEVMSYSNSSGGIETGMWYDLLNCGFRMPAVGGTDALLHLVSQYPAGGFRTYAATGSPLLSFEGWIEAIRSGRTFVTNGPLFTSFQVFGMPAGDVMEVMKGDYLFPVELTLESAFPVERVDIIRNGLVARSIYPPGDPCRIDTIVDIRVNGSCWIAARAVGRSENWFTTGDSLFAHTSPFYVEMEWSRICDARAAGRFAEWLEDLLVIVRGREDWESPADSAASDNYVSWGRDLYESLAGLTSAEGEKGGGSDRQVTMNCWPNPFNASLTISLGGETPGQFTAATAASAGGSALAVYDVTGRRVRDLSSGLPPGGLGELVWDGRDSRGDPVSSGVYLVRLSLPTGREVRKVILLR